MAHHPPNSATRDDKWRLCAKCGACTAECPLYLATGKESMTARGKMHLLSKIDPAQGSEALREIFSECLLCGACSSVCPRGIDVPEQVVKARKAFPRSAGRSLLIKAGGKTLAKPGLLAGSLIAAGKLSTALDKILPAESGLRLKIPTGLIGAGPTESYTASRRQIEAGRAPAMMFFTGCAANHLFPQIARATEKLATVFLNGSLAVPEAQTCCGLAIYSSGGIPESREIAKANINAFAKSDLPIIVSCASCFSHFAEYPDLLAEEPEWHEKALQFVQRLREFSLFFAARPHFEILAEKFSEKKHAGQKQILYHDPCHLRFKSRIIREPRTLIKALPNTSLLELPDGPQCCGHGGLFNLFHPVLSRSVQVALLDNFSRTGAGIVTTTCTGCLLQWHGAARKSGSFTAIHLAELLAEFV